MEVVVKSGNSSLLGNRMQTFMLPLSPISLRKEQTSRLKFIIPDKSQASIDERERVFGRCNQSKSNRSRSLSGPGRYPVGGFDRLY
jgi:hypothetical protein